MTTICHPTSPDVAQYMLQSVVHSVSDRPRETAAQSEARGREVEKAVAAFRPRDLVENMFVGLVVVHFQLILDATHDTFLSRFGDPKARGAPGVVALGRAMTGFLRELRIAQNRPLEGEEEARRDSPGRPAPGAVAKPEVEIRKPPEPTPEPGREPASVSGQAVVPVPPFRHAEASIAAMLTALSSPTKPEVVCAVAKQAAMAPPDSARASRGSGASAPEDAVRGALETLAIAGVVPGARPGGVKSAISCVA
jgi:hypothetical protein